jgi:hypothetical protein
LISPAVTLPVLIKLLRMVVVALLRDTTPSRRLLFVHVTGWQESSALTPLRNEMDERRAKASRTMLGND